jgi:hypothetical protein
MYEIRPSHCTNANVPQALQYLHRNTTVVDRADRTLTGATALAKLEVDAAGADSDLI